MGNRRTAKVAEAIREIVSSTILFELRDPRVKNVTVLSVEVPTDLRTAKVFVSVMGDQAEQRLSMNGLNGARGFIQSKVADRVNLRFTPILSFELDDGVKKSVEASRILRELAEERAMLKAESGSETDGADALDDGEPGPHESLESIATDSDGMTTHGDPPESVADRIDDG
ncbi:MAG: 30S ribosome-binding factor RbfA [Planctomycetaceae bacterium]|nr:30S ribosome-binding factor RbfA [Planctomycetaceae bacterium]